MSTEQQYRSEYYNGQKIPKNLYRYRLLWLKTTNLLLMHLEIHCTCVDWNSPICYMIFYGGNYLFLIYLQLVSRVVMDKSQYILLLKKKHQLPHQFLSKCDYRQTSPLYTLTTRKCNYFSICRTNKARNVLRLYCVMFSGLMQYSSDTV